ncbi:hypothetical protein STCU_12334 [Strigomonas culicis]|uniref:Transmembrane protein n=1 Tax=Strigomonas culicis TaxID=28005 RepID=S9TAX5_9TRYP|nr:hypothetical protein STCU_12334 [Strigomonas culicis]|eukprot:EPY15122.1 hypothetical protein STCU_12334 [Strigomonas culicis]
MKRDEQEICRTLSTFTVYHPLQVLIVFFFFSESNCYPSASWVRGGSLFLVGFSFFCCSPLCSPLPLPFLLLFLSFRFLSFLFSRYPVHFV